MGRPSKFSPEVRERAVRMVREHQDAYDSRWAAITSIAEKFGCSPETLRKWLRRVEIDGGDRPGVTTAQAARIADLQRENRQLREPTRSSARRRRISPRRSSTAHTGER